KALAKKLDCYISRDFGGSGYPAVKELGIDVINSGKKVMVRGWIRSEKISIPIPDIFKLESQKTPLPKCLGESFEHFLVLNKPKCKLVLGERWLDRLMDRIREHIYPEPENFKYYRMYRSMEYYYKMYNQWYKKEKRTLSLQKFYKLLFPDYTFDFKAPTDLSEYYDSEYSETESESSDSGIEFEFSDSEAENVPFPVIS
ncbi:1930_t:CDS:1, partial [Diversispora eburnea]